jgi:hypothetical protein
VFHERLIGIVPVEGTRKGEMAVLEQINEKVKWNNAVEMNLPVLECVIWFRERQRH